MVDISDGVLYEIFPSWQAPLPTLIKLTVTFFELEENIKHLHANRRFRSSKEPIKMSQHSLRRSGNEVSSASGRFHLNKRRNNSYIALFVNKNSLKTLSDAIWLIYVLRRYAHTWIVTQDSSIGTILRQLSSERFCTYLFSWSELDDTYKYLHPSPHTLLL